MDTIVGNITTALKAKRMWSSTLLVWSSDNGGAVHLGGGANAYPLRGGYFNNWEGGVRVAALVNGGFLLTRTARRGTKLTEPIHETDWYATFCHLAGVPTEDARASASDPPLPPVDSLNMWPLLLGDTNTSARREWAMTPLGEDAHRASTHGGDAAYMLWPYKLLVGRVEQSGWCGQVHPNKSKPWDSFKSVIQCNNTASGGRKLGCLFNVVEDPGEHMDLALTMPQKAREILDKMLEAEKLWFNPDRGPPDNRACEAAEKTGFWGPFV